jgi:hypothetical protein
MIAVQRGADDDAQHERAAEVDREDAEREGPAAGGAGGDRSVDGEPRAGGGAAEQPDEQQQRRAHLALCASRVVSATASRPAATLMRA